MPVIPAIKTKEAINAALEKDQGAAFRRLLHEAYREAVDLVCDAFRPDEEPFRSHLGASIIGRECARELWYSFRWFTTRQEEARIVRLYNRGHLEEPRFVAMLRLIGCQVWQYDHSKKQFRVSAHGGHYGGSLDSVVLGIPDVPGIPVLGEFKTHNDKSFERLVKVGVEEAKPPHWVQMQNYMGGYQLTKALYCAVNKDTDEIHLELVDYHPEQTARYFERALSIIQATRPPHKISNSPGWFGCKFCDHKLVCHHNADPARNCRTCVHSRPVDGGWICTNEQRHSRLTTLTKAEQLAACSDYRWIP